MEYGDVLTIIRDGIKFVSNFAGIIDESTPHLYLSALPFSPSRSSFTHMAGKFANIAQVVGLHQDWPRNQNVLKGPSPVWSVAFSPDGRHIVSGSSDHTIQVWDAQTGAQVGKLQGHTDSVRSVAFSPDGRHIVSGSADHTIRVWDAQTGAQVGNPLQGHTSVWSVALSPDGRYIVSGSHCIIQVWDVGKNVQVNHQLGEHTHHAFSPVNISSSILPGMHNAGAHHSMSNVMKDCTDLKCNLYLQPDGWIVGPYGELLLWVPPSYIPFNLFMTQTQLILSGFPVLKLHRMAHGSAWHQCFSSFTHDT